MVTSELRTQSRRAATSRTSPVEITRRALADLSSIDMGSGLPGNHLSEWSLSLEALRLLAHLVTRLSPRHILEFGSGVSTLTFAQTCAGLKNRCVISSVEHDPEFGAETLRKLSEAGLEGRVSLQIAPLVGRMCGDGLLPTYLVENSTLATQRPADLILIDGPPSVLGGREGIVYQALDVARPGTLILLDDANRKAEQEALAAWQENLGNAIEVSMLPGLPRGMAAIIVCKPVRRSEIPQHRSRLIADDIAAVMPRDVSFLLVDQESIRETLSRETLSSGRTPVPFPEQAGQYWGPPVDDETAIQELERERRTGAQFIVFVGSCYWWLEYYSGFAAYLRSHFSCVLQNSRLTIVDLRSTH